MYRHFVVKGDDAQNFSIKLIYFTPKAIAVLFLCFYSNRVFNNINTPLFFYVGSFP